MKKRWYLFAVLTLAFALCGCGTELTEEENQVIAEYAADLLLKYDADYQERLLEDDPEPATVIEETETEEIATENSSEENDAETEENTESVSTEEAVENTTESGEMQNPPSDSGSIPDIAEIVGIDGMSILYNRCMFLDRYPSLDQDGAFIYLEAEEGYKLVVVKFDVANLTSQDIKVDLLNTDIEYKLVMNQSKAAKPMLTILMDDLGTFQATVPANSEQSAVLVFQMSEGLIDKIESLDIQIGYQEEIRVLHMQ